MTLPHLHQTENTVIVKSPTCERCLMFYKTHHQHTTAFDVAISLIHMEENKLKNMTTWCRTRVPISHHSLSPLIWWKQTISQCPVLQIYIYIYIHINMHVHTHYIQKWRWMEREQGGNNRRDKQLSFPRYVSVKTMRLSLCQVSPR